MTSFSVKWFDRQKDPKVPTNPAYPDGVDLDLAKGRQPQCKAKLPYPAKRLGYHLVTCRTCKLSVMVTTAGRRDDPRSVTLPCLYRNKRQTGAAAADATR